MRTALSIGALLVTITSYTEAGNSVYVDADATGPLHDGSSWCSAYLDLQQALAVAGAGTEIRVAQGVYRPAPAGGSRSAAFAVPGDVTLLGSFQGCSAPDPDERDYILYTTILSGDLDGDDGPNFANRTDNVYHVVTTHYASAATVLDGLTIRGGHADGPNAGPSVDSKDQGSGVNNYYGQPTLSNCTLVDNYSTNHGAFNNHGSATLINCEFRDNWSGNIAAGLYMHFETDTTVIDCEFHDNTTAGKGGGAYLKGDSAPTFSGCLFSGNNALLGGGMYCDSNNSPTLSNCTFRNNRAGPGPGRGGGVYALDSTLILAGCIFRDNEVTDDDDSGGGAIYIEGGTLQLDQCDFISNRSLTHNSGPGGVYHNGTLSTITQCLFDGNTADYYGSAITNDNNSVVTVEDCVFTQNSSKLGAVYNISAVADFSRCRFTDNHGGYFGALVAVSVCGINVSDCVFLNNSGPRGAALRLGPFGPKIVTNTLFAGNVADDEGGAIWSQALHLSLINCVFSGNRADSSGGAIQLLGYVLDSQSTISNCTFVGNSAGSGRAIALAANNQAGTSELIAANSIFRDDGSEIWVEDSNEWSTTITYSNIEGGWPGVGNIAVNPMFVDPDGDDDLPGTEDDNLRLSNGSPSVNVGDNGAVVSTTDADGMPRIRYGVVDMGAYEIQEPQGPWPQESPTLAPPPHDILKNRYISIDPRGTNGANVGWYLDIRLTLSSTEVNGVTAIGSQWWANAPDADCIAVVGPTRPVTPPNWDACPTLHLTGCPIIPTSLYDIVMIDGSAVSDLPLVAATQAKPGSHWHGDVVGSFDGDVWSAPNGVVNITDAQAAIRTFVKAPNATHVSITDVHPNLDGISNNRLVNANDVLVIILGFKRQEYPGPQIELCADP